MFGLGFLVLPFILVSSDNPCPAPSPCVCEGEVIFCSGKNLTKAYEDPWKRVPSGPVSMRSSHYDCRKPMIPNFAPSPHVYRLLTLSNNYLTEIQADAFSQIHVMSIEIEHNLPLASVHRSAFSRLPHLQDVHIDNNNILSLESGAFSDLSGLTRLDLSHNKLTIIHNGTFVNLPKLELLFMDFNDISTIETGTFVHTDHLGFINLGFNSLVTLDYDTICHIGSLTTLNLLQNKLVCECSLSWVEEWREEVVLTQAGKRQIYGSCKRKDINANSALYVHIFRCPDIVKCRSQTSIVG